jgi:hypothetical protein
MALANRVALFLLGTPLLALAIASGCSSNGEGTSSGSSSNSSQSTGSETTGSATTGSASTGSGGAGGATTGSGGAGGVTTTSTGSGGSGGSMLAPCQGKYYQCGDGVDNDGDGKIDGADPDCLGPCDNTEDNFYGGIPGQAGPDCTVDCYFDQDSGSGNDDCHWNHQCDPLSVAPNYYPEKYSSGAKCAYNKNANTPGTSLSCAELSQGQSQACYDYCKPLVPNGCDCFGCCELPAGSGKHVWLGSEDASGNGSCSLKDLADPTKCQPCTPVPGCYNACGHCELCIGKDQLPPDCNSGSSSSSSSGSGAGGAGSSSSSSSGSGGGSTGQCDPGVQPCGLPGQALCPGGYYCITGCCILTPK